MLDSHSISPYNTSFLFLKSDATVHLAQWQYWWWFWFSLLWVFYYVLSTRIYKSKLIFFTNKLYTSYRPRGKWGDFLACILPLMWCFNILLNSNFILRLNEWQTEFNLYYIRIKGRQWYWVYKLDNWAIRNIYQHPKKIGREKWLVRENDELVTTTNLQWSLKKHNSMEGTVKFLNEIKERNAFFNKTNKVFKLENNLKNENIKNFLVKPFNFNYFILNLKKKKFFFFLKKKNSSNLNNLNSLKLNRSKKILLSSFFKKKIKSLKNLNFSLTSKFLKNLKVKDNFKNFLNYESKRTLSDYIDKGDVVTIKVYKNYPIYVVKNLIRLSSKSPVLTSLKFNFLNYKFEKANYHGDYLIFKQKKVKKKIDLEAKSKVRFQKTKNDLFFEKMHQKDLYLPYKLSVLRVFEDKISGFNLSAKNFFNTNSPFKSNIRKRLLRVNKAMVFPYQVNVGVITNSFDIIHSWFLPGLNIKFDCIPGRATHHSIFFTSSGFFYGQCAEICGRYHHHMPIKIVVMSLENFIVWLHHFYLNKPDGSLYKNIEESLYDVKKDIW